MPNPLSVSLSLSALVLAGCASVASAPPASSDATKTAAAGAAVAQVAAGAPAQAQRPAGAAAPGSAPAAPGTPPPLRAFADVIKDAKQTEGLFTLYEKDDKVWIEISPEQLGQLFFLQANINKGLPDSAFLIGRRMLNSEVVSFRRQHNTMQLIARNFTHFAQSGTPLARAVEQATSDSLLASVPVVSQPHPDRKSVLIEANGIFFTDIANVGSGIEQLFRSGYAFDARNSSFESIRSSPTLTSFRVNAHYATARIPTPPPGAPAHTVPSPVRSSPDARSFFLGLHYSIARLPEVPMRPRLADDRIGYFNTLQWNYGNDATPFARQYVVHRWRLERPDGAPEGAVVEPKKPVTYWIDRNVPLEYRDAVRDGILEWNKAFEKAGFKNALVVKQQDDNDTLDTDDTMRASVKWFVDYSDGALAVGPSVVDPRTGEILDADISVSASWARLPRRATADQFFRPPGTTAVAHQHANGEWCEAGHGALQDAAFAFDLLDLRNELPMDSAEALRVAQGVIRGLVMHEVGHTLGLRHNFRSSVIYTLEQTADPAFTQKNGLTGSVMDYVPFNIALKNEPQGEYYNATLGPYDYWAIEYGYRAVPLEQENVVRAQIANRSAEPLLAYGTDEEISGDGDGMDPDVNQRDLGSDTLAYAKRRIALTKELWDAAQARPLAIGESYAVQRRRFESGMIQVETALGFVAKNVGGVTFVRDHAGTGRAPYTPVPAQRQREALRLVADTVFADGAFVIPAEFSRMPVDHLDRGYEPPSDLSLSDRWLRLQRAMMDRFLSDRVAQRLVDTPIKQAPGQDALSLDELYTAVESAVWSELNDSRDATAERRSLQREHARKLVAMLTRATSTAPAAEARSLHRQSAKRIIAKLDTALRSTRINAATRAHFDEVRDQLNAALSAPMSRVS